MDTKNNIVYDPAVDSWMVFFTGDSRDIRQFLVEYGFVDADVLHEDWFASGTKIYGLEDGWRSTLKDYGYCMLYFVGFPYHVIPKGEQTSDQYFFIKRLFDD